MQRMFGRAHGRISKASTFLGRLARDTRGNTMAIMAMAVIPLAGMVGGGVDLSRMYIVKTRLQHACDAGALAGRKAMGGGTWNQSATAGGTTVANYPNVEAQQFFDGNYNSAAYGATDVTRSFSESAGKVTGTASATVPMTLMRIFGRTTETLTVTCDAEMRLPNTDVMFVLDNTGSMDCKPNGTSCGSAGSNSKMAGLRVAVKCFYQVLARQDITDVDCGDAGTADEPSGGISDQVQLRFGFVPYSVNVNVGRLLPVSYFPDNWNYQSRQANWITNNVTSYPNVTDSTAPNGSGTGDWSDPSSYSGWGCPSDTTVNQTNSQDTTPTYDGSGNKIWYTRTYSRLEYDYSSGWGCSVRSRPTGNYTSVKHVAAPVITPVRTFNGWTYKSVSVDLRGLKNGTGWNSSLTVPEIGPNGTDATVSWNGCIEERKTVTGTNFSPIPSGAKDLDIDTAPSATDVDTQWKPSLGGVEYMRRNSSNNYTTSDVTVTPSSYGSAGSDLDFSQPDDYCPTEARKLQKWPDPSAFEAYVDSLTPVGNTYHDIGLLWGARFLSPTGIFASENAYTPKGGEIERHLIFMTDGDTQTASNNYAAYGLPWYDRRNIAGSDLGSSPATNDMNDEVNARFLALCSAIGTKNITIWVISFGGTGVSADTKTRLQTCANNGHGKYYDATDSAQLKSAFNSIAVEISQLRLTK